MYDKICDFFRKLNIKIEKFLGRFNQEDREFLPPAVEILETPPSPAGRVLIYVIISLFVIALAWACLGEIDEVVVAEGKIIPTGYTKTLQSEDKGIVNKINVKNGDHVTAGQVLMTLDPTVTEADLNSLKKDLAYYELNLERVMAELANKPFVVTPGKAYEEKDKLQQLSLYNSRIAEKTARINYYDAQINQKQDAVIINKAALHKNEQLLLIARDKEAGVTELYKNNAIGHFTVLQYRSERIELEQNVAMGKAQLSAAITDVNAIQQAKAQYIAEWNMKLQEEMLDFRKEYNRLKESERKAELKNRLIEIKAPVDGSVHQLEIHTLGAIVTEAQALMQIVPDGTAMEVESFIANKDVGFVHPGMEVGVKIETYNFQKFGVLKGKVKEISPDAIEDKERGRVFRVMVSLDEDALHYDNKKLKAYPGMSVSAEIKTRKKKVIDFFLEPFQTYKSEALRER